MTRLFLAVLTLALVCPSVLAGSNAADVVFTHGNIYTGNERQPHAEAIAVAGGKIVYVGSASGARLFTSRTTRVVDLKGATVLPGLTDAHYHLTGVGFREMTFNLEGCASLDDFLARVKARCDATEPGKWVTGRGWIETFWKPQAFPTREQLDAVSPKNPVVLERADGHAVVANSAALKLAGIDRNTPNPQGGEIMHDKTSGEPNGMVLDNAMEMFLRVVPPPTPDDTALAIVKGADRSVSLGWCQIQNAGTSPEEAALIERLVRDGKVKLRIYNAIDGPSAGATALIERGAKVDTENGRYTVRTIKVHFDGALGSKGAALLEPYSDYDSSGFVTLTEDQLMPMLVAALRGGIQVETHAIGDRANRLILDYYEKAFNAVPVAERKVADPRWRVEHAQILSPQDIPRFAKLGVIPSMQPSHAIGDLYFAPSRLGMKRLEGAYAWQSLLKTGAIIAAGSDAPVERGEPMIEFYAAVTRKDLKGNSGEGWHLEQAVPRDVALKMFTIWPAYAAFEEKVKGTIEPGKFADLTVLSADIMTIPAPEILKTRCVMTVIGGEIVYDASH
ncbi:MAG TPA: amidohydrolase [Blastocatellia bacterium]|nr:amidohydrolase [Blastocatellia bacterium]